ncbi:MAG: 5-(carboxyamino)imidazole ribonucleotide mutase [bacterium]
MKKEKPKISIIVGSDSDLKVMIDAVEILEMFKIDFDITIISAHRDQEKLFVYLETIKEIGVDLIIAGAGAAAALPGVIASKVICPVIGVPIKGSFLDGLDALLSIVQMPHGIPVATVGVNGAKNAALLAIEILALRYPKFSLKIEKYRKNMEQEIKEKREKLSRLGIKKYIELQK